LPKNSLVGSIHLYSFPLPFPILSLLNALLIENNPVFILGETYGSGIQDLGYGANSKEDTKIGFRVFDIYVGLPNRGRYLNDEELQSACKKLGLKRVPVLYRGPFSVPLMEEYTVGKETVSGKNLHLREGIVIRPLVERDHPKLGRVQLKSISPKYLLRSNATEYN